VVKIAVGLLLFVFLHAFHLIPQITSILTPGTVTNEFIFGDQGKLQWGLKYFLTTAPSIKVSYALLGLQQYAQPEFYWWLFMLFPLLFVLGFLWNRSRVYLLSGIFFLIALFFVSANITNLGLKLYGLAFQIPGFSMFRVYYGQWQWAYLFFYAIFLGQALAIVMEKIKPVLRHLLVGGAVVLLLATSWPFISGKLTDTTLWQSKNIKSHVKMDPMYDEVLAYLRSLPVDGKILSLPLNDHGYQVLKGENEAAYVGPSTITYLAARNEFNGAVEFGIFQSSLLAAAREKNYTKLKDIFRILNIKYIFYNDDPFIYGDNFPALPYAHVKNFFPDTQEGYKEFIKNLGVKEIKTIAGKYHVYEFDDRDYLPHVYVARKTYYANLTKDDVLFPWLFNQKNKRIALHNTLNGGDAMFDSNGIILKAKNDNLYTNAVTKGLDFVNDEPIKLADDKIKELESESADWNRVLTQYGAIITTLIHDGKTIEDDGSLLANKAKIYQLLETHAFTVHNILLSYKVRSDQEKEALSRLADGMVDRLKTELDFVIPELTTFKYKLDIPSDGLYELYISKDIFPYVESIGSMSVDGKEVIAHSSQNEDNFLRLTDVRLAKKQSSVEFKNLEYNNLVEKVTWHTLEGPLLSTASATFLLNDTYGNQQGLFRWVNLKPDNLYVVSFDYTTSGKNFWIKLHEIIDNPSDPAHNFTYNIMANYLRSNDWKTFRVIVQSGFFSYGKHILQIASAENKLDSIQIKNFSVVPFISPQIIARKLLSSEHESQSIPEITFRKINPTRYEVKVKNAKNPYTLVFLQTFNKNWKLVDPNKPSENVIAAFMRSLNTLIHFIFPKENMNDPIVVGQEISRDVFFDRDTFVTLGKASVAQDRHRMVNGYANAWDIETKDFDEKTDYTFVLEMVSQQQFYLSLIISIVTFVCCTVWLGIIGFNKNI